MKESEIGITCFSYFFPYDANACSSRPRLVKNRQDLSRVLVISFLAAVDGK